MDAFDQTLNKVANVLTRQVGAADDYGVQTHSFTTLATGVPVRVSLGHGRVKEKKAEEKYAMNYREVFLRPWSDSQGNQLSHLHWLQIDGQLYDIFQVDNPGGLNHHYEAWCLLVID